MSDEFYGFDDPDFDIDEEDDINCSGWFEPYGSPNGVFVCGAVGSEDCDECPCHAWLGLTNAQIDEMEESPQRDRG